MNAPILAAFLLAFIECGHAYKVRRDPGLTVSEYEEATGSQKGISYRTSANGMNYCCSVNVDVLNVGPESVTLLPYSAELTAQSCKIKLLSLSYIQGDHVQSLAAINQQVSERSMASHWPEKPLWLEVTDRNRQFLIPSSAFLRLSYYTRDFRSECGPISFKLPIDGKITIASTFTEPK